MWLARVVDLSSQAGVFTILYVIHPAMFPEVETLLRIQHHDQIIRSLDRELIQIPAEAQEIRDRIADSRAAVEEAKVQLQQVELSIKEIELDVQVRRDTVSKLKTQQYETRKNEEYQRFGAEIERYSAEISGLEDKQIVLMEEADEKKSNLEEARQNLRDGELAVESELADLEVLAKNKETDRDTEIEKRDPLRAKLDSTVLDVYDRLFRSKNGQAVVGLVDGVCQGCYMRVIKSTIVAVKGEREIAHCENCARFLYWWTDESKEED